MLYYLKLMISPEGLIFFILFLAGLVIFVKRIKKDNYLFILVRCFFISRIFPSPASSSPATW